MLGCLTYDFGQAGAMHFHSAEGVRFVSQN
jgi:hypothetical protein